MTLNDQKTKLDNATPSKISSLISQSNSLQDSNLDKQNSSQSQTQQIYEENFNQIIRKYKISEIFSTKLRLLNGFKIVFIFDDSTSMSTYLDDSPLNFTKGNLSKARRWDELQYYSNISIEIATLFNPNGCDVYFLNRGIVKNVKTSRDLRSHFQDLPQGYTPMRNTFNAVLRDNHQIATEKKLLVVILTDGEPTDFNGKKTEVSEFKQCLLERQPINNIFVTIVACTDDDSSIKYLDKWDREIKNLDVVDDFRNERDQIQKANGNQFLFSYGDYVVKSLVGSIDPELDNLDETNDTINLISIANSNSCCCIVN